MKMANSLKNGKSKVQEFGFQEKKLQFKKGDILMWHSLPQINVSEALYTL